MNIPFSGSLVYRLFYLLAFSLIFSGVLIYAFRKKVPLRSILLALTTATLFTVAGSKLFMIPVSQWPGLFISGNTGEYNGRSSIGGVLFGIAGLALGARFFRLDASFIRLYSFLAPVGLGLMKIGCFFNGCCYGTPTNAIWGARYAACTNAHYDEWAGGLISDPSGLSMKLHPVQLYEALLLFAAACIVYRMADRWKKDWSILFFTVSLVFAAKLLGSFFRAPEAINFLHNDLQSLHAFRLLMTAFIILSCFILYINEKKHTLFKAQNSQQGPAGIITYVFVLSAAIYLIRGLFSPFEMTAVVMEFVPALVLTAIYAFRNIPLQRRKIIAVSSIALPLCLVLKTIPQDTLRTAHPVPDHNLDTIRFHKISFGVQTGLNKATVVYNPQDSECGTDYTHDDYQYRFIIPGAGYSHTRRISNESFEYGLNLAAGRLIETNVTAALKEKFTIISFNPYLNFDSEWVGLGIGLQAGNIRYLANSISQKAFLPHGTFHSPLLPEWSLRMGKRDIIDFRYNYGMQFPTSLPFQLHEFSLGSGLGKQYDYSLRTGFAVGKIFSYGFFSFDGLINKNTGINLRLSFGRNSSTSGVFGANYRFGSK